MNLIIFSSDANKINRTMAYVEKRCGIRITNVDAYVVLNKQSRVTPLRKCQRIRHHSLPANPENVTRIVHNPFFWKKFDKFNGRTMVIFLDRVELVFTLDRKSLHPYSFFSAKYDMFGDLDAMFVCKTRSMNQQTGSIAPKEVNTRFFSRGSRGSLFLSAQ